MQNMLQELLATSDYHVWQEASKEDYLSKMSLNQSYKP